MPDYVRLLNDQQTAIEVHLAKRFCSERRKHKIKALHYKVFCYFALDDLDVFNNEAIAILLKRMMPDMHHLEFLERDDGFGNIVRYCVEGMFYGRRRKK